MERDEALKELKDWCKRELREAKSLLELSVDNNKRLQAQFYDGQLHVLEHLKNKLADNVERNNNGK